MAENTNKNTGGKAVNQNDILNIIDSSVKELESVIDAIIGLNQKIKMIRVSEIKDLRTKTKMLFGKRGAVTGLLKDIYDNYQFLKDNQYLSSYAKTIDDVNIIIEKTKTTVSSLKKLGISLLIFIFNEEKLGRIFNILHTIINGVNDLPVVDAKELVEKMSNIAKLIGLFHLAVLALILLSPSIMVFIVLSPLFVSFAGSCYVMAHTLPLLYYVIEGLSMTAVACSRLKDELRHVFRLGSGKSLKKKIGYLFDIVKLIVDKTTEMDGTINNDVMKSFGYITGLMIGMVVLLQITLEVKRKLFRVFLLGKGNFIKKQIGYLFDIVSLVVEELNKSSVRKTIAVKMLEIAGIFIALDIIVRTLIPIKRKLFRIFLFGKGNFMNKQIGYLFDIVNLVVGEISKSSVQKTDMVKMLELAGIFIALDIIVRTLIPIKRKLFRLFLFGKGNLMIKQIEGLFEVLRTVCRGSSKSQNTKTGSGIGSFTVNKEIWKNYVYIIFILNMLLIVTTILYKITKNLFKIFLFSKDPSNGMLYKQVKGLFKILRTILEKSSEIKTRYPVIQDIWKNMVYVTFLLVCFIIITSILITIKKKLFKLFLFGKGTRLTKNIIRVFNNINQIIKRTLLIKGVKAAAKRMQGIIILLMSLKLVIGMIFSMIIPMLMLAIVAPLFLLGFKLLISLIKLIAKWSSFIGEKEVKKFIKLSIALGVVILICATLLLIVYAFSKISDNLINIITVFILIFIIAGMLKLISKIPRKFITDSIPTISGEDLALAAILTLCSSLLLLVTKYLAVSTKWDDIFKIMVVTLFVAGMLVFIGKHIKEEQIVKAEPPLGAENIGLGLIVVICTTLLLLVTKYLVVSTKWNDIFKIILLVVVIAAMLVGLGYMMKLGLPILQATLMILGIVFLSVSAIFLIVLELFILQQIRLDYDKIKTNVSAVIKTSFFIISCIFDSMVDSYSSEEDNIFTKIFKVLFKGGASIFTAFLGAIILIATVVSVLAILLIAGMLWLLGKITLDEGAIRNNVGLVLGLAKDIINLIWDTNENKDGEESDKGWLGALIDYVLAPLGAILQAIMAVAYLALIVIAVLFILLIAGQLRLLQEIDLQEGVITGKVEIVFKIANSIISTVFNGGSKDSKESDKGWLGTLIDYVLAPLGAILQAIMAVAYLALIVIAVLFILLIAGQLRSLQEINLEEETINKNVGMVLAIANSVIDNIWNRKDKNGTESKKGFLRSVFDVMGIGPLMDALMSIAFLAQTVATVGLIKTIAEQLNTLQKIDLQSDKIETNVGVVIETARKIIDLLWNSPERKGKTPSEENKGFFSCVSSFLFGDKGQDIADMASAAAFLTQTLSTIGAIHGIAKFLNDIQNIKLEQKPIDAAVDGVINTSHRVIDKLWNEDAKNNKTDAIKEFLGLSRKEEKRDEKIDIEKMGNASSFMTYALISILSIYKIAKLLNSLSNIKLTEANINDTVDRVISTAKIISNKITVAMSLGNSKAYNKESDEFKERIQKIEGFRTYTNKSIETIIGTMNGWATGLSKYGLRDLATIDISDVMIDNIRTKTTNIFSLSSHILGSIHDIMKKLPYSYDKEVTSFTKSLSDLTTSFCDNKITSAGVAKQERALNNYAKFITKIQSLDLKKLESAQQMFKHMAEFAKSINGNFDRLADSINEKIMPLLKELNDNLVQFKETQKEIEITKMEVENGIKPDNNGSNSLTDQDANRVGKATDSKLNNQKEQEEKAKYVANTLSEISEILLGYHNDASKGFKIRI